MSRTTHRDKDALREIADEWRYGGSLIPEVSRRREAEWAMRGSYEIEVDGVCSVMDGHRHAQALPGPKNASELAHVIDNWCDD